MLSAPTRRSPPNSMLCPLTPQFLTLAVLWELVLDFPTMVPKVLYILGRLIASLGITFGYGRSFPFDLPQCGKLNLLPPFFYRLLLSIWWPTATSMLCESGMISQLLLLPISWLLWVSLAHWHHQLMLSNYLTIHLIASQADPLSCPLWGWLAVHCRYPSTGQDSPCASSQGCVSPGNRNRDCWWWITCTGSGWGQGAQWEWSWWWWGGGGWVKCAWK